MSQHNLYAALRAAFPADLQQTAIEARAPDGTPLYYTWADLEHASARLANLLATLDLPPASRIAVQVEKSVDIDAIAQAKLCKQKTRHEAPDIFAQ